MDLQIILTGMCLVFANVYVEAYRGILRNKPINSTPDAKGYESRHGTNGIYRSGVILTTYDGPFFQVDLQELYILSRVIVISHSDALRYAVRKAKVGVSKNGSSFFQCGQFPSGDPPSTSRNKHGFTVEFPCPQAGAVRYVKIWQEQRIRLAFWEIDADGFRVPTCTDSIYVTLPADRGILKNKTINSTGNADGTNGSTSDRPFFQVDLHELFIVLKVIVTSQKNAMLDTLKTAMIGVSKDGDRFTHCGQWPNKKPPKSSENIYGFTLEFPCFHAGPVRYVKIWKETKGRLGMSDMDAEGVRIQENAVISHTMRKISSQRVQDSRSVPVFSLIHCAMLCRVHFCRFFSYSAQQNTNCLLADSGNTVRDVTWGSWSCIF